MPVPPNVIAIRDTICARLRDNATVVDSETIAARLPKMTRLLRRDGVALCADDHAALSRGTQTWELLHCFGSDGHVVAWALSAVEVYAHCQALHTAGYLQKFNAEPSRDLAVRWAFIEPALAGQHRQVERFEQAEFAALARLAGDLGRQR